MKDVSDTIESPGLASYGKLLAGLSAVIVLFGVSLSWICYQAACRRLAGGGPGEEIVRQDGRALLQTIVVSATIGTLLALAVTALLVVVMTRPIRTFLESVMRVCRDEPGAETDPHGAGSLGPVTRIFVQMADRLRQSGKQLEEQVQQRTRELSALNRVLASEVVHRVRMQEKLKESLSLLEATLEATADGILVTGMTGEVKNYNRQFQDLWQIPDTVLEGGRDEEVLACVSGRLRDPDACLARGRELHARPETERCDILELRDGTIIERCSKPQILGDHVVGRVLSFRDITETHLAEEKQAALLRRVTEVNEELTHFAYAVSHDLKAPLRGIKLIAEWLCADYADKLDDEARQQFALLKARVERMHNLIDGILQYSRVGRIREDMVDVDLNELIPAIVDTIAPPDHIRIAVDEGLPVIECEKTRITQVFQNLLTNAVKFIDKPEGEIRVSCEDDGRYWRFSVTDNGLGIEEKHFERIFRIFQTLTPRDEFENTGVGLALVKRIVEMYGGRIGVESEVGRGSTFLFTFPKKSEAVLPECLAAETA